MSNIEKMLAAYDSQTDAATDNEKEIVTDSCCDLCCDGCVCCSYFIDGRCF